jgi:branched-chain amino acid transport system substrate-binding protein
VRAAYVANRLMTQDEVVATIGPATSNNFIATIPAAMQNKIPTISATATADRITVDENGNVYEYVFRIIFNDSFQGIGMANFAINNLGAKKAVVFQQQNNAYSEGLATKFIEAFEAAGGSIVAQESYESNDTDFNSLLTSIKEEFDVIFLPGYYQEAGLIIKQARELGITAPILGGDAFDSPILLEIAGASALNNVFFTTAYSPLDQDSIVQNFINAYKNKYGVEPNAFSALGYDAAKFLADAIKRADTTDPEAIKTALAATQDFTGVTGSFRIDEEHNPIKDISVIGLENGIQTTSVKVEPK